MVKTFIILVLITLNPNGDVIKTTHQGPFKTPQDCIKASQVNRLNAQAAGVDGLLITHCTGVQFSVPAEDTKTKKEIDL